LIVATMATAAIYYSLSPLFPEAKHQVWVRLSYQQGWWAAWRMAIGGRYAYDFSRYTVEGLSEFAEATDDILPVEVPSGIEWSPNYLAGFDKCMAGKIGNKLQCDFPDAYVRHYLANGWLNVSKNEPTMCPVHKRLMVVREIPLEIMFPLTMPHPKYEWDIASEALFPFPGSTMKVDGAILRRPKYARTRVCDACTEAERRWLAAKKSPNQPPLQTPTSGTPAADAPVAPPSGAADR
jgi:hypothetical protein